MTKKCPFMSWQYKPSDGESGFRDCMEKDCPIWTGLECSFSKIKRQKHEI